MISTIKNNLPKEVPTPDTKPETIPPKEPVPEFPQPKPEIEKGKEPLNIPPIKPSEIPPVKEASSHWLLTAGRMARDCV